MAGWFGPAGFLVVVVGEGEGSRRGGGCGLVMGACRACCPSGRSSELAVPCWSWGLLVLVAADSVAVVVMRSR